MLAAMLAVPAAGTAAPRIQACFAPALPGGCDPQASILDALAAARTDVLVQAYVLTARPIVRALIAAHGRGVDVQLILDRGELRHDRSEDDAVLLLVRTGIPVAVDEGVRGIAHNKVIVIDGRTVITGSYNFTWSAEHKNAENLLVIHDPGLAAEYARNWRGHRRSSQLLKVR